MLERFDAALALAGAGFIDATPDAFRPAAPAESGNRRLDLVRLYCRELHAALKAVRVSGSIADLDKARNCCRIVRAALLEVYPAEAIPFRCMDASCTLLCPPRTTCWLGVLERAIAPPPALKAGFAVPVAATPAPVTDARARMPQVPLLRQARARANPLLARQGVGLLALIAAYLLYFHIDVQLQILNLAALFP